MKLVMTLLVRNEEDILRDNLEFHLAHGVDFFVCTDNLSEDGTPDILDAYWRLGVLEWRREESDDYSQSAWVTRMARTAAVQHRADWVVNNDADEFWMATSGSLKARLAAQAPEVLAIECRRYNFPEIADCDHALPFYRRMPFRDLRSVNALGHPLPGKVCHRGLEGVVVAQGNHAVSNAQGPVQARRAQDIEILHFPVRSYQQFEQKIVLGGAAYGRNTHLDPAVGGTWRSLYSDWQSGKLRDKYESQIDWTETAEEKVRSGRYVRDERLTDTLVAAGSR
jgi:hypothetical protein